MHLTTYNDNDINILMHLTTYNDNDISILMHLTTYNDNDPLISEIFFFYQSWHKIYKK